MYATYNLKADELNNDFIKSLKNIFKGKEIEITISDLDETEYLLKSEKNQEILLNRIKDIEEGKNITSISSDELEQLL